MLAQNNNDIQEAISTVYQLTQEEKIRQQCEAREDYYRTQNDIKLRHTRELAAKDQTIAQLTNENAQLADENARLRAQLEQLGQVDPQK